MKGESISATLFTAARRMGLTRPRGLPMALGALGVSLVVGISPLLSLHLAASGQEQ